MYELVYSDAMYDEEQQDGGFVVFFPENDNIVVASGPTPGAVLSIFVPGIYANILYIG